MDVTVEMLGPNTDSLVVITEAAIAAYGGLPANCTGTDLVSLHFHDNGNVTVELQFLINE